MLFGGIILKHQVDQILAVQLYFLLKYFFKFQKQIYFKTGRLTLVEVSVHGCSSLNQFWGKANGLK
jgi:hypothetical protein